MTITKKSRKDNKCFYASGFMDLSNYHLERISLDNQTDREAWNSFVESSEQGTVFSRVDYLEAINEPAGLWYCYKNQELKAAIAVIESDNGKSTDFHEFVIYNGIMFAPDHLDQNRSQVISERFRCTCFIVSRLVEKYDRICLSLSPGFVDIRPFLWHNYGQEGKPYFITDVRFTSFVNIDGFADASSDEDVSLFSSTSASRRQEIRYAVKKAVYVNEEFQIELFMDFYQNTLLRQQINVGTQFLHDLQNLILNLKTSELVRMFVAYTAEKKIASIAIFGINSKRAYYLFGANNPDLRNSHTGTAVLWEAFRALNKSGVKEVDLEGINSPRRGYFKLSFGGSITPYYRLFLGQ